MVDLREMSSAMVALREISGAMVALREISGAMIDLREISSVTIHPNANVELYHPLKICNNKEGKMMVWEQ
jgi:hypothetical protein